MKPTNYLEDETITNTIHCYLAPVLDHFSLFINFTYVVIISFIQ